MKHEYCNSLTLLQSFVDLRIRILSVQSDVPDLTITDLLPIVPELETAASLHYRADLPPNRPAKSSRNPSIGSNVSNLKKPVTSLPLLPVRANQLPYNDPTGYQRQEADLSYVNIPAPIETVIAIANATEYIPADENLRYLYEQSNIGQNAIDEPQQNYSRLNAITPGPSSTQYDKLNHDQPAYSHLESASTAKTNPTTQGYAHIDRASFDHHHQSMYVTPGSDQGPGFPSSSYATPINSGLVQPNYATPVDLGPQANYATPVDLGPQQEYASPVPPILRNAKPREIQLHSYVNVDSDWNA